MGECTQQPPAPPPPLGPPQKGTRARRVGDIVPCRAAMNRHGPTPGDTRLPPPPRSRGAPVVPRAGSNPPPPPEGLSGFAAELAWPSHAPPSPAGALGGACPGPVRPRGDGEALPPPPPGFASVDDARRDSSPPSGVRAPSLTVAPHHHDLPGLPGRLWPAPAAPPPR